MTFNFYRGSAAASRVGMERAPPLLEPRRRRQALINSGRDQRREPPHRLINNYQRRP